MTSHGHIAECEVGRNELSYFTLFLCRVLSQISTTPAGKIHTVNVMVNLMCLFTTPRILCCYCFVMMSLQPCTATTGRVRARSIQGSVERELPDEYYAEVLENDGALNGKDAVPFTEWPEKSQHHRQKRGWIQDIGRGLTSAVVSIGSAFRSAGKAVSKELKKEPKVIYNALASKTGHEIFKYISSASSTVGKGCCPLDLLPCCLATKVVSGIASLLKTVPSQTNGNSKGQVYRKLLSATNGKHSADVSDLLHSASLRYDLSVMFPDVNRYVYQPPRVGYW